MFAARSHATPTEGTDALNQLTEQRVGLLEGLRGSIARRHVSALVRLSTRPVDKDLGDGLRGRLGFDA